MLAAKLEDVLDPAFFPKVIQLADEFDLEARFGGQTLGILPDPLAQGRGPLGEVEDLDLVGLQESGHALGIANAGGGAHQHQAIITGQRSGVALSSGQAGTDIGKRRHRVLPFPRFEL